MRTEDEGATTWQMLKQVPWQILAILAALLAIGLLLQPMGMLFGVLSGIPTALMVFASSGGEPDKATARRDDRDALHSWALRSAGASMLLSALFACAAAWFLGSPAIAAPAGILIFASMLPILLMALRMADRLQAQRDALAQARENLERQARELDMRAWDLRRDRQRLNARAADVRLDRRRAERRLRTAELLLLRVREERGYSRNGQPLALPPKPKTPRCKLSYAEFAAGVGRDEAHANAMAAWKLVRDAEWRIDDWLRKRAAEGAPVCKRQAAE